MEQQQHRNPFKHFQCRTKLIKCFRFCFEQTATHLQQKRSPFNRSDDLRSPSHFASHDQIRQDFLFHSVPYKRHMFGMCLSPLIDCSVFVAFAKRLPTIFIYLDIVEESDGCNASTSTRTMSISVNN